jgi:hypothetical protein
MSDKCVGEQKDLYEIKNKKKLTLHFIESLRNLSSRQSRDIYRRIISLIRENGYSPNKTQNGYLLDINSLNLEALNAVLELQNVIMNTPSFQKRTKQMNL